MRASQGGKRSLPQTNTIRYPGVSSIAMIRNAGISTCEMKATATEEGEDAPIQTRTWLGADAVAGLAVFQ